MDRKLHCILRVIIQLTSFTIRLQRVETLETAYAKAKEAGVLYPYLGNVHGHKYENTYCPNCGENLIQRHGYTIVQYKVTEDKKRPKCHRPVPIRGRHIRKWHLLI